MYHTINKLYRDSVKEQVRDWILAGDAVVVNDDPVIAQAVNYHPHYHAVSFNNGKQIIGVQDDVDGFWYGVAPRTLATPLQLLYEYRLCRPFTKKAIVHILQQGDNAICGSDPDLIAALRSLPQDYHVIVMEDGCHIVGVHRGDVKRGGWIGVSPVEDGYSDVSEDDYVDEMHNDVLSNLYSLWTYKKKNHVASVIDQNGSYVVCKKEHPAKYHACKKLAKDAAKKYTLHFADDKAHITGVCVENGKWCGVRPTSGRRRRR
ncbi:MAG: hypothetical protein CL685_02490 [Candidatus Magasanikbacteria bacterium]|nr:hypothetical protein [Candidatus Magasanikbacteria bacterium]|tara:strand:+ start:2293 stop:3075 length:783 start_codon:yes stop_codon:yes gene_type:complete